MRPISPTAINIYRKCPRKFFYYINRYPALAPSFIRKAPLELGKAVHKIIRRYYEIIPDSMVPSDVNLYVKKAYHDFEVPEYIRERVESQLLTFIKFEQKRLSWHFNPRPIAVEREFTRDGVHGIVDALFRRGKETVVVDWKTGRNVARATEDLIVQLNVYLWLTGADKAYAIFLEYGDFVEVPKCVDVEGIVRAIREDRAYVPRKGTHCDDCEFQILCWAMTGKVDLFKESFWWVEV